MGPLLCAGCATVLSADGLRWGPKEGFTVSRRSQDGAPIVGHVGRPDRKGTRVLCRSCCVGAVEAKRAGR